MKTTVGALLIFLSVTGISISQSGWVLQNSTTTHNFVKTYFINQDTGFCSTWGHLVRTSNGGQNWVSIPDVYAGQGIFFINNNTGFVQEGELYKSTNVGQNWTLISPYEIYVEEYDIYFCNENTGFRCGGHEDIGAHFYSGRIQKTINGGYNWSTICEIDNAAPFRTLVISDSNNWYATCDYSDFIRKSADAGRNWTDIYIDYPMFYWGIYFINRNTGFVSGSTPRIFKTTNAGINWTMTTISAPGGFNSIYFVNENTGFAVGDSGKVIKTTDAGGNWFFQRSATTNSLRSVLFLNSNTGFAAGFNGTIMKTTDGGGEPLGIEPMSNEIPSSFSLSQNYPNPFNPSTKIKFDLPKSGNAKLIIYDVLGREVATLVNEQLKPGSYEVEWDGSNYASGIYFYQLTTEQFIETKRMVLIK